ncbi:BID domain-containing T4SS effector [Bartonella doshiae]|uniref:BID domain-containing T4SS effector n=1 Tax=Bartonella doshiae TaxID=33044 RepID=UPI001ABB3966|nr:BID domain-containing T4SS effector [Bartonella doshiae]
MKKKHPSPSVAHLVKEFEKCHEQSTEPSLPPQSPFTIPTQQRPPKPPRARNREQSSATTQKGETHYQTMYEYIYGNKKITARNFMYPYTTTLRNKYGTRDHKKFEIRCAHDVTQALINLRQEAPPQKLTSAYLLYLHHALFKNSFEWAGQTRDKPFTFASGITAYMPEIKKANISFASGEKVQEGLKNLDKTLSEKNSLKGLIREEFVENAAQMMTQLNYTHPFIEGNGRTQQLFFEKLAEVAGHSLDFSLVTKERMKSANIAALKNGNSEEMRNLFEEISNPEKTLILKEFMNHMKKIGLETLRNRIVMTAKEGQTYTGFYRGSGENGFMLDANGTFIIGHKKDLRPEQIKALKIGDPLSFTAPTMQESQEILIAKEIKAPLSKEELIEKIKNNAPLQERKKKIASLSKYVYGKPSIILNRIEKIYENPAAGEELLGQMAHAPRSISKLAGFGISYLKTNARARAEENLLPLFQSIDHYIEAVEQIKKDILECHSAEQKRCDKTIRRPGQWIQTLYPLSKEQRKAILSKSPELRAEITIYSRELNERLSADEHQAIKENNFNTLAKSLGTSENNAKKIIDVVKNTQKIQEDIEPIYFVHREFNEHTARNIKQTVRKSYHKTFAVAHASTSQAGEIRASILQKQKYNMLN